MIVNIICSYNELRYLPKVVRYYQNQGVEVYVADNFSSDGTWEWLNDNKIPCEQFDTDGRFDLVAQQNLELRLAKKFKNADWIIYGDADEFIVARKKITDIVNFSSIKRSSANLLRMPSLNLKNTGETIKNDPTKNYFYYAEREYSNEIIRIHKNLPNVRYGAEMGSIAGDIITFSDGNIKHDSVWSTADVIYDLVGNNFELRSNKKCKTSYQFTKTKTKSMGQKTIPENFGSHLIRGKKANWKWDKSELTDIRTHELYALIEKYVIPC